MWFFIFLKNWEVVGVGEFGNKDDIKRNEIEFQVYFNGLVSFFIYKNSGIFIVVCVR